MDQGFILNFKFEEDNKQGIIKIALKYNRTNRMPAITKIYKNFFPWIKKI